MTDEPQPVGWGIVTAVRAHEGYCGVSVEIDQSAADVGIKGNAICSVGDDVEYLPEVGDDVCILVPGHRDEPIRVERSAGDYVRPKVAS